MPGGGLMGELLFFPIKVRKKSIFGQPEKIKVL